MKNYNLMKGIDKRQWLPHIIVVFVFFVLTAIYFAPVFQGQDILQSDAISSQGWGKDALEYYKKTGEQVYWSNMMFGGMPCNYTFSPEPVNIFKACEKVLTLSMFGASRRHIGVIFLSFVGFYIFLLSLGCRSWLAMAGSIAYTLCSYNFIIITAGHMNKGLVMATMAPIIGGVIMCYRNKLLWGSIVTLIFTGLNVYWNHQQISYYLLLVLIILAMVYFVYAIREKRIKEFFRSSVVLLGVAVLAVLPAVGQLVPSADYAKDSMRGGAVLQQGDNNNSEGLDIDYAYQWSYGVGETLTLLVPNMYGAASSYNLGTDSETYELFKQVYGPVQAAEIVESMPAYWGPQPFTSGPVYVGAIVCLLFVFGLFVVKGREKWWLLAATILSVVMSWGRFFPLVNEFLFYNLPLYSKFRAPSMALVVASFTMVTLGILAVKRVIDVRRERDEKTMKGITHRLYISFAIIGGVTLVLAVFGAGMFDFSSSVDARLDPLIVNALRADRASMLTSDAWRSFLFVFMAFAIIYCYIRFRLKTKYLSLSLAILFLIDLWVVDKRFLSYDDFMPKRRTTEILPTAADRQIMQDKHPDYRVLNLSSDPFNESRTSYFHKSVGGYSPAKLRRYQDIIDAYFLKGMNPDVINMLNVRYIITREGKVQLNPSALGNCWFVDRIEWVDSPDAEFAALSNFEPLRVAYIDKEWQGVFEDIAGYNNTVDSTAYIELAEYRNPGEIVYESYSPNAQLAVFSEVFYKTWKAYIDGKEVQPVRADYILRALPVPAGKHIIEFRCVDELMITSYKISLYASILVGVVLLSLFGVAVYRRMKK